MVEDNTDVMVRLIADHQARLRTHSRKQVPRLPGTPSRLRRLAGQTLIRLGEQIRGERRDANPAVSRPRMATR
jgi:hypothetical protein